MLNIFYSSQISLLTTCDFVYFTTSSSLLGHSSLSSTMASKSPEEKVEFLLKVLATCTEFKPDYAQLKDAMGINTNANAQRQFKGIVEAGKMYTLESGGGQTRVIDNGGESVVPSPHTKARKHTKKGSDDGKEEEKPVKKPRTPKTKKVVEKSDDKETE